MTRATKPYAHQSTRYRHIRVRLPEDADRLLRMVAAAQESDISTALERAIHLYADHTGVRDIAQTGSTP